MATKTEIAKALIKELKRRYKNPNIELENWETQFQLLICVILSAQATDISVNKVTGMLFGRFKNAQDFASAKPTDIEPYIKSINYYKTKAKRVIDASKHITQVNNGELPHTIEEWVKVPGVGRKSANVMMNAQNLNLDGIVVDTHVSRVANRLGLTQHKTNAVKIENDLKAVFPKEEWSYLSTALVLFGRYVCKAKKPSCEECGLKNVCVYYNEKLKNN